MNVPAPPPLKQKTRTRWQTALALSWMALAAIYVIYAAETYTGLYQALAELELRILGSYDGTGTFLFLLIALCLPTRFIAPAVWKKRLSAPIASPVDAHAAQRNIRTTMLVIASVSLAVGIGAAVLASSNSGRSRNVVDLDLARSGTSTTSAADRALVSGRLQHRYAITTEETLNGSVTRTLFTPLTAPDWRPGQPVEFVLRDTLAHTGSGDDSVQPSGPADLVRFGPVALFHHALPGMVRTGFERHGLSLAASPIVLDQNLHSASDTPWVISIFGFIFALSSFILWAITHRTHRLNSAAVPPPPAPPLTGRLPSSGPPPPPGHWELRLGGELMAELSLQSYETPWTSVTVKAHPGIEPFWRNFEDPETWPDNDPAINAMLREIKRRGGFTLTPDGAAPTRSFTLVNFNRQTGDLRA